MEYSSKPQQKTVLITGCSDGGLGAALAVAFHQAGYRVFATARTVSKMASLKAMGIETLTLDVLSDPSISGCVDEVTNLTGSSLNILLNNAGALYCMPISDLSIPAAKKIFDLHVWSNIATIQEFLPLLMKAHDGGMVVNNTSVGSVSGVPFQAAYNASKAAIAMFTDLLRIELQVFNIKVVDLKTGGVTSKLIDNITPVELPLNSIYATAREEVSIVLVGEKVKSNKSAFIDADIWAKSVVNDLTKKNPPYQIWRGGMAWLASFAVFFPVGSFDGQMRKLTGLDVVFKKIKVVEAEGSRKKL